MRSSLSLCALGSLLTLGLPAPALASDLQLPEERDTRHSAYSLPDGMWAFDVGALGVGAGDAYAKIGAGYGFGAGFELDMNLAHASVGLINLSGRWHFLDTELVDLGASLGIWYGHGEWFWILTGPAKEAIRELDAIYVPVTLAASMPVLPWLGFDLELQYNHAEIFGTLIETDSIYIDSQLGFRQFVVRPGARFFLSDNTELDLSANLPPYSAVPREREASAGSRSRRVENFDTLRFSEAWSLEAGLRSRFKSGLYGTVRMHYGEVVRGLYGAVVYPSFNVEFRL